MEWQLAGYMSHPIDGDAGRVGSLATHLGAITADIRTQVGRIRALDSSEFWQSTAGSADAFQEVVQDLPQKLDLVATRYETVAGALDLFHPTLAGTKQDAEYWIEQAAEAQSEIERAESGIELMEDYADQAERDAEAANEDRAPGDPEVQPETWPGEDYRATREAAQADLDRAVANCQSAVGEFRSAGDNCAQAIQAAANDGLKDDSGLFAAIAGLAEDILEGLADLALDVLEAIVEVLGWIAAALTVIALVIAPFFPPLAALLGLAALAVGILGLAGSLVLYANGRTDEWGVATAALGLVPGGLGKLVTILAPTGALDIEEKPAGRLERPAGAFDQAGTEVGSGLDLPAGEVGSGLNIALDPGEAGSGVPIDRLRAPSELTGLSSISGLEAAFRPAQQNVDIDPGLAAAIAPPGLDVPTVDSTAVTPTTIPLPQTAQIAVVPMPEVTVATTVGSG